MAVLERTADELALRRLAYGYGLRLDDGDGERFADVFIPKRDAGHPSVRRGLRAVVRIRGPRHAPGGASAAEVRLRPDAALPRPVRLRHRRWGATGIVYTLAHHVHGTAHGGTDHVMRMSYRDAYVVDASAEWKIADRVALIPWTETRAIDPIGA